VDRRVRKHTLLFAVLVRIDLYTMSSFGPSVQERDINTMAKVSKVNGHAGQHTNLQSLQQLAVFQLVKCKLRGNYTTA